MLLYLFVVVAVLLSLCYFSGVVVAAGVLLRPTRPPRLRATHAVHTLVQQDRRLHLHGRIAEEDALCQGHTRCQKYTKIFLLMVCVSVIDVYNYTMEDGLKEKQVVAGCRPVVVCVVAGCRPVVVHVVAGCRRVVVCVVACCRPVVVCVVAGCRPVVVCVVAGCRPVVVCVVAGCRYSCWAASRRWTLS